MSAQTAPGRAIAAVAAGAVAAEVAAVLLFSGPINQRIDVAATGAPAVVQASADLARARADRGALDSAVDAARVRRDEALVVARCEYNPSAECPQTRITGVPGSGPETRTANELLDGAQQELDTALAARTERAPGLDAAVAGAEGRLGAARSDAVAQADRGPGARWVAMNGYTFDHLGALLLRLALMAFCILLAVLALFPRLWRAETGRERRNTARTERERADLDADTAIAVKQAEVRAAGETLWAEQQLVNARFAVQAQTEIDREHHRRRVLDAVGLDEAPPAPQSRPQEDDMFLPIAAAAEAASLAPAEPAEPASPVDSGRSGLLPAIPQATAAAARWIRPLVPPIVARAIDTTIQSTVQPVRAARQAFEEIEEITFSFKRVHKVTLQSEERAAPPPAPAAASQAPRVDASFDRPAHAAVAAQRGAIGRSDDGATTLQAGPGPTALAAGSGPRELPPAD